MTRLALILSLTCACATETTGPLTPPDSLPSDGRTFAINSMRVPESAGEAMTFALDLDDDDRLDNLFGQNLALAMQFLDLDANGAIDEAIAGGSLLHLLMLATDDLGEFLDTGRVFLGADTDDDPSNNFDGVSELAIRAGAPMNGAAFGEVRSDGVDLGGGAFEIESVILLPLRLQLESARIVGTFDALGRFEGKLAGAMNGETQRRLRLGFAGVVAADANEICDPSLIPCCPADSRGEDFMNLFDGNDDCVLEVAEVAESSLAHTLVAPDVDTDGDEIDDGLSAGFRITAVPTPFIIQ